MNRTLSILVRRLGSLLATLVVMSFVIFMLVEIMPGDVAQMILGQSATEESVAALREARGLDDPVLQRYGRWIKGVVVGDLGESIYMQGVAINSILWRRVGHSLILALTAFIMFVPLSIFFGVLAGVKEKKPTDSIVSFLASRPWHCPSLFQECSSSPSSPFTQLVPDCERHTHR